MTIPGIHTAIDTDTNGDPFAMFHIPGRPALINGERSRTRREHRGTTKVTRRYGMFAAQALTKDGYEFTTPALIVTQPTYPNRASWPDVGNWAPHIKAIIDGLVDAGAWPNDTHKHVSHLSHASPIKHELGPGLLVVIGLGPEPETPLPELRLLENPAA